MASLSLKNICKVYPNGFEAVKDFNLEVEDQEFIIFVGPSGCGKSTTLRMIAGLEEISSGEFYIDGKLMNDVEPKDRDIAMVFQNYALYPHMTVFDNMAFGLKLRKVPKDEIKKKVMSMYTDPDHIKITDPGKIEGNTVFTYLDAFCQPEHFERYLPDYANLDELKAHYQRGGLGDVKVKKFLNNVLQETLEPIRNRRKELEKDIPAIYEMLKKGSEEAEKVAAQTLADVKAAMKINYFDDLDLIRSQAERYGK